MNTTPYANNLFEQPWWLDIVAPRQWHEVFVKDADGSILGRMPYVLQGKKIVMPPLTQTLGIWMSPDLRQDYGAQKKCIFELWEQLGDIRSFSQALSPDNDYVLPFRWLGCRMEPRFTYRLNDLTKCEELYQNFNKTAKKNIKSAKNKVTISHDVEPELLLTLLDKTFEAQNRKNPMPRDVILRIIQVCEETGHGKFLAAKDADGNTHSCAYFVYDENVCYYLFGASDNRFRSSGAQSLILWEGIQFAAKHAKVFDFEGSMVEGIENFFRQFGGVCTPYYEIRRDTLRDELLQVAKPRVKRLLGYKI